MKKIKIRYRHPLFLMLSYFLPIIFFFNESKAQDGSKKLEKKIAGLKNMKAIMKKVERFYEDEEREKERNKKSNNGRVVATDNEEEFESELLHWKRWEYYNQSRLKPNGDLEDITAKTIAAWEKTNTKYGIKSTGTNAQWNFLGPWNNSYLSGEIRGISRIDRIVFHPTDSNTFYACSNNGGLWRTTDGGATWISITFNFPIHSISGLVINPTNPANMWVLTGDGRGGGGLAQNSCGIWVTYDGGGNWIKTNFNSDSKSRIYSGYKLVMMPGVNNFLFAATRNGLYRSIDGGINWTLIINGVALNDASSPIYDIEFDPSDATNVYVSSFGKFYKSIDFGATFPTSGQTSISGANRIEIGVSPNNSNYVYLLCGPFGGGAGTNTFKGLYRSASNGSQNSFSLRANTPNILSGETNGIRGANDGDQSNYDLAIDVSKSDAETIIVGGKITWRSSNGGTNFTNITTYWQGNYNQTPPSNYIHPDIQDIAFNPLNGYLYAGTDGGIYRSTDNGTNWTDLTSGIHATTFYHMASASFDANKILAGAQDNGLKFKRDAGDILHLESGDGFSSSFGPSASSSMYSTINETFYRHSGSGVYQSQNTPANTSFFPVVVADPVTNNTVYLLTGGAGIQKSTNGGNNWSQISTQQVMQSANISPANASRIYVAGTVGTPGTASIFRSDNGGTNWSANLAANAGFPAGAVITDIFACTGNSDFVYVTTGGYTANQKVYYSGDAGATWGSISGTLPSEVNVNCVVVDVGNNAYIGTDVGVFYQAYYSNDWTPFYNGIPRCPVTDLAIHQGSSKIRASTYGHGIWEAGLYSPCDAFYTLSGYISGPQFYQVSNTLTVNAKIVGGDATKVITRAGNRIVLSDGFRAYEHNIFKASIGGCESGPVPQSNLKGKAQDISPTFISNVHKGDTSSLFSYGNISVDYSTKNKVSVNVQSVKTGIFKLIISNKEGDEITPSLQKEVVKNEITNKVLTGIPKGKYYAKLYFGDILAHFQEIIISQ